MPKRHDCQARQYGDQMICAAILAALVLLFGLAGHMDYEDQQAEQAHYCEMVKAGFWPDYQGTYRRECRTPTNGQR